MWTSRALRRAAVLLTATALAFAGWAGWSLWQAHHGDAASFAAAREDALRAGRAELATFTTLDHTQVAGGLARWLDASTGSLHDELSRNRDSTQQQAEQARTSSRGTVEDAALTAFDPARGTATLIAAVQIEVTPDGGQPVTKRNRCQADLVRTDTGWKLATLTQVPVATA